LIETPFELNISRLVTFTLLGELKEKRNLIGKSVRASAKGGLLMGIKGIP
jgi:hypothetical protein